MSARRRVGVRQRQPIRSIAKGGASAMIRHLPEEITTSFPRYTSFEASLVYLLEPD